MSDTPRKTTFAWASIAGADPEPVEVIDEKSFMGRGSSARKGVLTTGCQDPFWLDDTSAGVVVYDGTPLKRPPNPQTQEERDRRQKAYEWHRTNYKHGPDCEAGGCTHKEYTHGWRGPR
jgi:hypothetical protein